MYIIAGLGNPGRVYKDTRHNAGFMAVDRLARNAGIKIRGFKYKARTGSGKIARQQVYLLKPRTYMNLSGTSVKACLKGLKTKPANLIVVHDDLDLAVGRVKVKDGGGTGGHKGLESIIANVGTRDFTRVRIGVGRPPKGEDAADYVLEAFDKDEATLFEQALDTAEKALITILEDGVVMAMNQFNSK